MGLGSFGICLKRATFMTRLHPHYTAQRGKQAIRAFTTIVALYHPGNMDSTSVNMEAPRDHNEFWTFPISVICMLKASAFATSDLQLPHLSMWYTQHLPRQVTS